MRVLAVTTDASLEVALVSLERSWQIVSARTIDAAAPLVASADVALVSLGTTERGLAAVRRIEELGLGIRCLILGDVAAPDASGATVLPRPFSMNELVLALTEQTAAAPQVHPPSGPSPAELVGAPPPAEWAAALLADLGQTGAPAERAREHTPKPLPAAAVPEREAESAVVLRRALSGDADHGRAAGGLHRLRKRRLLAADPTRAPARGAMLRRVQTALEAATDLEGLLRDLPALSRTEDLADGFVLEGRESLGAETVAVFVAAPGGWRSVASHGLTASERSMTVPESQPVFKDVASRVEAVLVSPVDLVRGLVAGIPGSTADSLMVAPLEAQGTTFGVVTAGRDSLESSDLERFWSLAEEAAPALAAARLLERLRSLMAPAS